MFKTNVCQPTHTSFQPMSNPLFGFLCISVYNQSHTKTVVTIYLPFSSSFSTSYCWAFSINYTTWHFHMHPQISIHKNDSLVQVTSSFVKITEISSWYSYLPLYTLYISHSQSAFFLRSVMKCNERCWQVYNQVLMKLQKKKHVQIVVIYSWP